MKIKKLLIILILASFSFASICSAETNKEKTASATRKVITFNMGSGLPLKMIECPAGDFIMGCSDEEYINEYFIAKLMGTRRLRGKEMSFQEWHKNMYGISYTEKPHKVTISKPFYIGKFEITQSQYEYIMGSEEYEFIMKEKDNIKGPNKPMEWVDYLLIVSGRKEEEYSYYVKKDKKYKNAPKIESFLEKINTEFANQLPSGYKFDLPTEAQWKYACKAGTGKDFVDIDEVAWYKGNNGNTKAMDYGDNNRDVLLLCAAHDVGQKKPNAWGIYDMLGNVSEICKDYYADYPTEAVTDPINLFKISFKNNGKSTVFDHPWGVARGGNYDSSASMCRSTTRYPEPPRNNIFGIGFRLVLVPVD